MDASHGLPQVLVLLSDPILERVYRAELGSAHYCAVWCEKGERWKENLLAFPYDVVVVDLGLFPNPQEIIPTVRKLAPDSAILALCDPLDARTVVNAYQNGVTECFLKPVSPETIRFSLESIVRKKKLLATSDSLNADLLVFSAAHRLHQCEDDAQMRRLSMKNLAAIFGAAAGAWLWPDGSRPAECLPGSESLLTNLPTLASTKWLNQTFEKSITAHPTRWINKGFLWIPLRDPKLGGLFLLAPSEVPDNFVLARAEFLVRNLEIALENRERYASVKQLTLIDDVTGLYNSRYLEMAVGAAIEAQSRFSVLFIDIDRFKGVNDGHGHLIGSQMLVELAELLKQRLRRPDLLFRYGGDEFIALMYGADPAKSLEAAERLRAEVEAKRFFIEKKEFRITLSIGVATFPDHGRDKKQILEMADQAMYHGKKEGRNKVFSAKDLIKKAA